LVGAPLLGLGHRRVEEPGEEVAGAGVGGTADDLVRVPVLDDDPAVHEDDPVGDLYVGRIGDGFMAGTEVSLRWVLIHMIEEYARHNGHADILRERIDGVTGY